VGPASHPSYFRSPPTPNGGVDETARQRRFEFGPVPPWFNCVAGPWNGRRRDAPFGQHAPRENSLGLAGSPRPRPPRRRRAWPHPQRYASRLPSLARRAAGRALPATSRGIVLAWPNRRHPLKAPSRRTGGNFRRDFFLPSSGRGVGGWRPICSAERTASPAGFGSAFRVSPFPPPRRKKSGRIVRNPVPMPTKAVARGGHRRLRLLERPNCRAEGRPPSTRPERWMPRGLDGESRSRTRADGRAGRRGYWRIVSRPDARHPPEGARINPRAAR